ncbi:hypothetical protein CK203_066389 [Vitis vinifera]|uniref:Serine/threonine-protein phosphatase 7 long form-like n=1 Tax=Vitis vinifera TaxID=29760 RepID=A0A438G228_VITVI|nr:hypothetical protein CK203_066389 [Vitis vinifera]
MEYKGHSSDPDPLDTSVLVLQDRHRSHLVDSGQDVAVILGLRIHGLPITGTCDIDWSWLCYELLGVTPPTYEIKGSAISTRWLCYQFSYPPVESDDATLERELCRVSLDGATDIAGYVTLLQARRFGGRCHLLFALTLLSGIDRSECCDSLASNKGYLNLVPQSKTSIPWIGEDDISALGDIHRIAIDILHVIEEDHRIHFARQSPTSSYPSMRPPVSATTVRMQPIRARGRDSRRDGGRVDTTLPSPVFPPTEATIPDVTTLETTPLSTNLLSPLPCLEETTTPHVTSPSSLISPLLEPTILDVIASATTAVDVILPSPISPLLDATISDITILEINPPSTTLPSPPPLPIETTMHHTLTHVTQLDVCPPRRRRGPRRRRVLPPLAPSQPIHTETWQIAQIDSTKMSLYHKRP